MRRSPLSIKKIVIALPAGRKNLVHSNRIYISVTATVNIKLSHELINNVALLLYFIGIQRHCHIIMLQDCRTTRGMISKIEMERTNLGRRGLLALFETSKIVGMLMA